MIPRIELPPAHITGLTIFDVKALAGRPVETVVLTPHGLQDVDGRQDHRFIIADAKPLDKENTLFQYLRQNSLRTRERPNGMAAMALIQPEIDKEKLTLKWLGEGDHAIEADSIPRGENPITIQFARDQARGFVFDDEINRWLSERLNYEVVLIEMDKNNLRAVPQQYFPNTATIFGQDAYPYNVGLEESAAGVAEIAGMDIPLSHYRPQISIAGMPDKSEHVIFTADIISKDINERIATVMHLKPGVRCKVTGVVPGRGILLTQNQPLKALGEERTWINGDGGIDLIFAENVLLVDGNGGRISVDDLYVPTSYRSPQLTYGSIEDMRALLKEAKPQMAGKSAHEIAFLLQQLRDNKVI